MIFNDRVKQLRKEHGMIQEDMAKKIGVTTRAFQRLETNAKPHYDSLFKIAEYFDVSVDWLMGRTERREVWR